MLGGGIVGWVFKGIVFVCVGLFVGMVYDLGWMVLGVGIEEVEEK